MSRQRRVRPPRDRRPLAAAGTVAARTGASPDIGVPPPAAALEELEALYAQLPDLQCRGLCEHSCAGHVDASHLERARILQRGVDLDAPTTDGSCPALTRNLAGAGRCAVHPVRPTVCRLWGAVEAMPCPHSSRPAGGPADDAQALRWLLDALRVGGHRHSNCGVVRAEAHCCDPAVAAVVDVSIQVQDVDAVHAAVAITGGNGSYRSRTWYRCTGEVQYPGRSAQGAALHRHRQVALAAC